MKKFLKIGCLGVVGFALIIGILGALVGGGNRSNRNAAAPNPDAVQNNTQASGQSEQKSTAPDTASKPEPTVAPTPVPAVGQDVKVDEVRWKILTAEDLGSKLKSDNQFVKDKTTPGRFVKIHFEMENLSKDMLSFAGFDLVDDQGRTFKNSSDALQFIPSEETCVLENLNPNVAKTCTVIYEIPANAKNLKAQVGDLKMFSDNTALIDLRLQ